MNNLPKSQAQLLDDQLAEFTDLLLAGQEDLRSPHRRSKAEGEAVKRSVLRMQAAAQQARLNPAASARIRAQLIKEWKEQQVKEQRLSLKSFVWPLPRLALTGSVALIILLSLATFLTPTNASLTGTAGGLQAWTPFFIATGVLLILVIFWLDRRQ